MTRAFAKLAHFALEGAGIEFRRAALEAIADVADGAGLSREAAGARAILLADAASERAQLTFREIIDGSLRHPREGTCK